MLHQLAPADSKIILSKKMSPSNDEERAFVAAQKGHKSYSSLVGSISCTANPTRPDITLAVNQTARFAACAGPEHFKAVKKVFRYLKGTQSHGLLFGPNIFDPKGAKHPSLFAFCDSDWARCPDTRRSTGSYQIWMFGAPVLFRTFVDKSVSLSSAEAEYRTLSDLTKDILWTRKVVEFILDLKIQNPTSIYVDNQAAIAIANNPVSGRAQNGGAVA